VSQQINLYNPLFLRKEKYFSARTMLQSLGLIALGLIALYAYGLVQSRDQARLAGDFARSLAEQRAQFLQLGGQDDSKLVQAEVARLEAELSARRGMLDALQGGELGNTDGFSRYFAAFGRHAMRGVWLTGFSVGESGNELKIRGRVLYPDLVPAYLRALNKEEVMRGRQVTALTLVAKDESAARRASAAGGAAAGPERFVEFDLSVPLRAAEPAKAGTKRDKP
jgi:hypothetical protein